jgi:glycosyltransferase involved in cell wall biosynthesis
MLALAERLPRDRFKVEFIALAGPGPYDARAEAAGARVRSLGSGSDPSASLPLKSARRISKILQYAAVARHARYDIVDAWLYPSDVLAAIARPITRTPVIIAGRRNIDPQNQFGRMEDAVGAVVRRMTDMVVANSANVAAHAIANHRIDPARIMIIRNGVELATPLTAMERASSRRELMVSDDEVVIGCVANYRDVKRLDRLVDAFATLAAEGHPVRLELIGEGPTRPELEQRIRAFGLQRRACLHGSVANAIPLYGGFDIVAQTSEREGLPNSLLEAGAAGRAIVATAAGGSSEIVIDGETGLLVPVDDPEALTAALRRVVTDVALRDRLGAAVRLHVATVFGMDRFVAEFAGLYEALAAERGHRT